MMRLAALLICASTAWSQTFITSLPCTISSPGSYELRGPLSYYGTNGAAITIAADHVTLDLGDDALLMPGGSATTATGVEAYNRTRVTVRRGAIRNGLYGVRMEGCNDARVENLDVTAGYIGVIVQGDAARVDRVRVTHTGWTTLSGYTRAIGIRVAGDAARVTDCSVHDIVHGEESMGVNVVYGIGASVERCVITNVNPEPFAYGVWTNSADTVVRECAFVGWGTAIGIPSGAGAVAISNSYSRCTTTGVGP